MTEATVPDDLNDKEKSKTPLNHMGLHSLARETLSRVVLESHFLCLGPEMSQDALQTKSTARRWLEPSESHDLKDTGPGSLPCHMWN